VRSVAVRLPTAPQEGRTADLHLAARLYLPHDGPRVAPPPLAPGLVVGHGAGSRAANHEDFCLEACRHGFAVMALDFRGHGGSEGVADGPLEYDILAAVGFLRGHPGVDPELICYRGSSMGGFYGLKAQPSAAFTAMVLLCPAGEDVILDALNDPADATIATDTERGAANTGGSHAAGAASTRRMATTARWDRPRLRRYFESEDSRLLAARVTCPVLLVHARHDQQVPFEHSLLLTRHLPTQTTLLALEQGDHTSAQHDPAIHAYTAGWLRDMVEEARTAHV